MNRVLTVFAISLIMGIVFPFNVGAVSVAALILTVVYLICYLKFRRHFVLTVIVGFTAGVVLSAFSPAVDDGQINEYIGKNVSCTLTVNSPLNKTDKYTKFEATVETIEGRITNEKVIVYVYNDNKIADNARITFEKIKFKLPSDQMNYGGFNYRKYLTGKGIFFTATADSKNIASITPVSRTFFSFARELNTKLSCKIDNVFSKENGAIFKALLLGNKNDIDDNTLGDFRNSGLSHVMAVSGLHLSIIVMLLGMFTKYIGRWGSFIISTVAVTAFVFVTGMPVSVIRAAIMLFVLQLADALYLENDSLTNLSLAVLIVLIPNPNAVYDISFVMSFSATLGILCLSYKIRKLFPDSIPFTIRESVCVTLAAQIATLPFSAMYFGQLSLLAVISNLLIVVLMPLIYLVGIPAIITGWTPLIWGAEFVLSVLAKWASVCSELPGQMQYIPINSIVLIGLFIFSLTAMSVAVFRNKRIVSWILALSVVVTAVGAMWQLKPIKGSEITFLNVGQADSSLVRTENSVFLVDTATEYMGDTEITSYLLKNGITRLDGIFVSHFDTDHCGGLLSILEHIDTEAVYVPDTHSVDDMQYKILKFAEESDIPVFSLKAGDRIKFSDVNIEILSPTINGNELSENDESLVFRAENKDMCVLFTGDIIADSEIKNCDTDILKVSHHGSKNGTSEKFLANNTPQIAVMSLAENNSYGFPHDELMNRLKKHTNMIYRTDLNKTVTVKCRDREYEIETMK